MTTFNFQDGHGPVPAHRHPNGGGWVADTAFVDDTAYVAKDTRVYGNAWVGKNAVVTRTPVVLTGFPHTVTITDHHVAAGCEMHPPSVWLKNGVTIIANARYRNEAPKWAAIINALAAAHGCTDLED